MKPIKTIALVGLLGVGAVYGGDGSSNAVSSNAFSNWIKSQPQEMQEMINRIQAAKKLPVPLPPTTPYDSDPHKREVYLKEYQSGYRLILAAANIDGHMGVKGDTFNAYMDGWDAGREAGMKDHPEKVAQMWGVPLDSYLQYLKNKSQQPSPNSQ